MIEKPCKFRAKEAKENVLLRFWKVLHWIFGQEMCVSVVS
jgi:hypothetical protein